MSDMATYKKVKINGEDHILKYGFNAISDLEAYYDKGIWTIINEERMGFNLIRTILWAGMLWNNPQLKVHHVGQLLEKEMEENEEFDFTTVQQTTLEALIESKAMKLLSKKAKGDDPKN
ncbi:hypothetical protein [Mesobacillus foraminis]|uniref:Uncharacterized protein n=1 Tax=Mesobacillus foraminis TaxID=279826 RepID=A0A4R2BEU5_9BACI|nr:hypothetical protein [Mesobacillus foraminis]TCN25481.1 hypothetical protein EV146_105138 [Mesobacillus foraminis]